MYEKFGLFIAGEWCPAHAGKTTQVISPVTEKPVGTIPEAGTQDTLAALDAAASALAPLREMGGFARADAMHRIADAMKQREAEAIRMVSTETGKPLAQSTREWNLAIDQFRWYAEEARRIYGRMVESRFPGGRFEVAPEAVGVVGAFVAWNFPTVLSARKYAPALAAGCSVVLRPPPETPGSAMILVDCMRAGNLPPGAANLITGAVETTYTPIMADPRVRKITMTGSTRVGRQMLRDAAETIKRVGMELGGNAPLIVYEDADLESALEAVTGTKFANAGQVCVAPDRFFIHESRHDEFVDGFVKRAKALKLGDGLDESTAMGPLISARRLEEVDATVQEAIGDGAALQTGGQRAQGFNAGHFYEPTVLTEVRDDMKVFASENFGPVAPITRFHDEDEVIARANDDDMGLAAYAFTASPARARRTVARLQSGMVGINATALAASEVPFGGVGFSGLGREGGREGIEDYLNTKLAHIMWPEAA